MKAFLAAAVLIVGPAGTAFAQDIEDLNMLEAHASEVAQMPVRPLDRRIRLARCPEALAFEPASRVSIAVRCERLQWRIHVMLAVQPTNSGGAERPVIRRGDVVDVNYVGEGFVLVGQGIAQTDAGAGRQIRVKNPTTTATLEGIATSHGSVLVAP